MNKRKNNKDWLLSDQQKSLLLAVILTDGWLELGKGAKNYRVGFSQGSCHYNILDAYFEQMKPFVQTMGKEQLKSAPLSKRLQEKNLSESTKDQRTEKKYATTAIRTVRHPEITKFARNFIDTKSGLKTVPSVKFIQTYLSWESFAWMIMLDGSAHDPGRSQGIKLHLQNFSYEEQSHLCFALYHKLGIQCWPTFHRENNGQTFYHIRISGRSLTQIRKNVMKYIINDVASLIPPSLPRTSPKPSPYWLTWYKRYKKNLLVISEKQKVDKERN